MAEEFVRGKLSQRYRVKFADGRFLDKLKEELDDPTVSAMGAFHQDRVDIFAYVSRRKIAKIPVIHSGGVGRIKTTEDHCEALQTHNGRNLIQAIEAALHHAHIDPNE